MHLRSRNAFTLLELVAVLAVLAILTAIAVPRSTRLLDARRERAAREQLAALREAVLGPEPAAGAEPAGFLADMGRLPQPVVTNGLQTLSELWQCPEGAEWRVRQATAANGVAPDDADPDVWLAFGWRGPYAATDGDGALTDPWGRLLANPIGESDAPLTIRSGRIEGVRLESPAAGPDDPDALRSVSFRTAETDASLVVSVQALDRNGSLAPAPLGTVRVRVYQPDPDHPGRIDCVSGSAESAAATAEVRIGSGLLPGRRTVRVESSLLGRGPVREVDLRPGDNLLRQTFTGGESVPDEETNGVPDDG